MSWCLIYISCNSLARVLLINLILSFTELECEADFVEAERGQLSHELAPELILDDHCCIESLELLLFTKEPRPPSSAGWGTANTVSSLSVAAYTKSSLTKISKWSYFSDNLREPTPRQVVWWWWWWGGQRRALLCIMSDLRCHQL